MPDAAAAGGVGGDLELRVMESAKIELIVIAVAMVFFLIICATAVALFIRQWRRERGSAGRLPRAGETSDGKSLKTKE